MAEEDRTDMSTVAAKKLPVWALTLLPSKGSQVV